MKESQLFLAFFRQNWLLIFAPIFIALSISIFAYSTEKVQTKLSQAFKMEYKPEQISEALLLVDQAVNELRLADFDNEFSPSTVIIYKSAPLTINIDVLTADKNQGFALLIKETEYLKQNFTVSTLTQVQLEQLEPSLFKYLLTGLLLGFFVGLVTSLIREYFKNY